jgi:hypothetical protein
MDSTKIQASVLHAEFTSTSEIRHINGAANVVADTLSRWPGNAVVGEFPPVVTCVNVPSGSQVAALRQGKQNSSPTSLPGVADVQLAEGISFTRMADNKASCTSTLQATLRTVQVEEASLLCDVARGITRPLVPVADRATVFHAIHSIAHPCICATRHIVTLRFVRKGAGKYVAAMCSNCQQCQHGKVHKELAEPLHAIPVLARRFSHVHMDLVVPPPASSEGHVYLLTAIDRSTMLVEALPLPNMEASMCTDLLIGYTF